MFEHMLALPHNDLSAVHLHKRSFFTSQYIENMHNNIHVPLQCLTKQVRKTIMQVCIGMCLPLSLYLCMSSCTVVVMCELYVNKKRFPWQGALWRLELDQPNARFGQMRHAKVVDDA